MSESSKIQVLVMLLFVVAVQILALAITPAISASGNRVFEDPTSISNPFAYMLLILVFTGLLLLAIRLKRGWVVSGFIFLSIAVSIYYVIVAYLPPLLALVPTLAIMLLLRFYPEWYIIDAFGILVCAGISSLFGVSMAILPALLLLVVLAVYDAISVYKTRHMVSLAEGAIKIKAPLLFVVPKSRDYSFRKDQAISTSSGGQREGRLFPGPGRCRHTYNPGDFSQLVVSCPGSGSEPARHWGNAGHIPWFSHFNDDLKGSSPGGTAFSQLRSDSGIPGRMPRCRRPAFLITDSFFALSGS